MATCSDDVLVELESVPAMCAVVRVEESVRFEACNSLFAEALGLERDALAETRVLDCVHDEDLNIVAESLSRTVMGVETKFQCRVRDATNGWATFEIRARPHPVGAFAIARDVTDQSRRREHLQVLNRVLRHNVRNDFNVIDGHLQLISERTEDTDLEQSSDVIHETLNGWLMLTKQATRIEQLFSETAERQLPVENLIRGVITASELTFPNATIEASVDNRVSGTVSSLLEEAIHELCDNAAKHTTESPIITVNATPGPHPGTLEIAVTDDGPGLPSHEVSVLRTGEETPLIHGSGLGLQLVRMVVEHVGGTVDVDVEADGAAVVLSVPIEASQQHG